MPAQKETKGGFAALGLKGARLDALDEMGFETPTPIQERAIPVLLEGEDLIGQARTGTGKTAAFGLPILENIDGEEPAMQALILCPTRELAIQVAHEIERMGAKQDISVLAVYGGADMTTQVRAVEQGVHIVAGTPGRVMDHMRRGTMSLHGLKHLVLDEADRMLDMGFIEDIDWILAHSPPRGKRQMALFSATMPHEIMDIAERYMRKPKSVIISADDLTVPDIEQVCYSVGRRNKLWALSRIIEYEKPNLMLVFCATKRMVDILTERLNGHGYGAEAIHGDLSQARRENVLEKFKAGKIHILVATDVAARGLDIDDITHVVNYDLPEEPEVYVHRVGRTGRAGREGKAITFISKGDKAQLAQVERFAGTKILFAEVPGEEDLEDEDSGKGRKRDRVRKVIDWEHVADRYGNVHMEIDVGRKEGATMGQIHSFVRTVVRVPEYAVGAIKIEEDYSRFDIPKEEAPFFLSKINQFRFNGRKVAARYVTQEE